MSGQAAGIRTDSCRRNERCTQASRGDHCLGAPIPRTDGNAIAGRWITGLSTRLSKDRMVPVAKKAGAMVAAALRREMTHA